MTELTLTVETITDDTSLDELKALADSMSAKYHPNAGRDVVIERILEQKAALAAALPNTPSPPTDAPKAPTRGTLKKAASKLIRCRITCMNPNKREDEGEIFTVSNAVVGTFKKFIPYDTEWHIPQMILNVIKGRKCQIFRSVKLANGKSRREGKQISEFAIEILPPLSAKELKELAQRQAMASGTSEA